MSCATHGWGNGIRMPLVWHFPVASQISSFLASDSICTIGPGVCTCRYGVIFRDIHGTPLPSPPKKLCTHMLTNRHDWQVTTVRRAARVSEQHLWEYDDAGDRDEARSHRLDLPVQRSNRRLARPNRPNWLPAMST